MLPSFYIIGERKCGTSSLFRYLCNHPQVVPGRLKEPNFFIQEEQEIQKNWSKYLDNFPTQESKTSMLKWPELNDDGVLFEEKIVFQIGEEVITGEASANTMVDVDPEKLKRFLPDLKLIIILREPVERTYSHYRMFARFQQEGRSLGMNLMPFSEMIDWEIAVIKSGSPSPFVYPSRYYETIRPWIETYGNDQVLVLFLSELLKQPARVMNQVFKYLGLPEFLQPEYGQYNVAPPTSLPPEAAERLKAYFNPYNELLFQYLRRENHWVYE